MRRLSSALTSAPGPWEWDRILKAAGLAANSHTPKCLRDTFASQLLSNGVSKERIQRYLGHSSVVVTETHYAKWVGNTEEWEEMERVDGEVTPDFMARLPSPPSSPPSGVTVTSSRVTPEARNVAKWLRERVVELGGIEPPTLRLPA